MSRPYVRIPIRTRLTLWYMVLLAVTFTAFGVYLIVQSRNNLIGAIEETLQITVSKTTAALDEEDYLETGRLTFDHVRQTQNQTQTPGFAMRIISVDGEVWDSYGVTPEVPAWGVANGEYLTQRNWRIYSQPVLDSRDQIIGWVQAAQSLESVNGSVLALRNQLFLGVPLLLLLAGLGGYFLAGRALQPIAQITGTAQAITVHDLSRRLQYRGVMDEIGRLAQTFDQMLERLQASFERESRFISDAAHELRTPLTALKGQIDVTLTRTRKPSEYEEKLRESSRQVDRLIHLSNALLFLARSDHHSSVSDHALVDLSELLTVLVEGLNAPAAEKGLKMIANLPASISTRGNNDQLIRLFMNLLENALKYTPAGGEISITLERGKDEVRTMIHNNGVDIPPHHLPHLFERFYRIDADRSSQSGGSGLGLAIASSIADQHGGSVEAWSETGKGVTFTVRLPSVTG